MKIRLSDNPFVPPGWDVLQHKDFGIWDSLESLKLTPYISAPQANDIKITGHSLLIEIQNLFPINANLLDFFIDNQSEIPDSIKELCPLFFMGTIYFDETGRECVRCLCHSIIDGEEKLYWRWRWLSDYWRKNNPVLMLKNFHESLVW
ncbi:MAG: hypothetical protein WC087_00650 [Candidatus Paceibacterota bacterium]